MAAYKVPQDVEAEDKLVGPFGFRQFVYLGVAGLSGFIAYLLARLSLFLVIIPIPVIIFCVVLALPLRKEQPMETYLLALLRFYLKPKLRLWNPDGTITYVEIIAPKVVEQKLAKDLSVENATERLDYLARIMDSRGWSLKGENEPTNSVTAAIAVEAQTATDVLDEDAELAQSFATKIAKKDEERRQQVMTQMREASVAPAAQGQPAPAASTHDQTFNAQPTNPTQVHPQEPDDTGITAPHFNPYPNAMHQRVIVPLEDQPPAAQPTIVQKPKTPPKNPVPEPVSPDIIRLANNDDLSISAIAHEAHRLQDKVGDEVVINLH
ncbi:MAG TPA: PrgI family protein [Candidatus Saccharimonas sp.]|nr:PrgI family protein [Candidatus Saccharimonas sp.]